MSKVSLDPETYDSGSGFLDGWITRIIAAEYVMYDGNGKWEKASPCLCLTLENDRMEDPTFQYWSAGDALKFRPAEDGNSLVPMGDKTHLHATCNLALLFKSFVNAGLPKKVLEAASEDITALVGAEVKWVSVKRNKDSKYGTPLVDEIVNLQGEGVDVVAEAGVVVRSLVEVHGEILLRSFPKIVTGYLKTLNYDPKVTDAIKKFLYSKDFLA